MSYATSIPNLEYCQAYHFFYKNEISTCGNEMFWDNCIAWLSHEMETFFALLAICAGNSPVTSDFPHKGQWRGALMFSLISAWINAWVNNREAGDLRRRRPHYDVTVICTDSWFGWITKFVPDFGHLWYARCFKLCNCVPLRCLMPSLLDRNFTNVCWSTFPKAIS